MAWGESTLGSTRGCPANHGARLAGDGGGGTGHSGSFPARPDDRGAATLEAVILFPVMLLLIMIVVQMALFFHVRGVATAGARAGLDAARVEEGSAAAARAAAEEFLEQASGGMEWEIQDVSRPPDGDRAEVTVYAEVMSVFPRFVFTPTMTITVDAPIEQVDG